MIAKASLVVCGAIAVISALAINWPEATEAKGRVRVIDGDTIQFTESGTRVRLAGIDAPEAMQPCLGRTNYDCGLGATVHLIHLIGNAKVVCQLEPKADPYGRRVGDCTLEFERLSLNLQMVSDGYALDSPHYSHHRFSLDQVLAEREKRGLWAMGGFQEPWQWRAVHKVVNAIARQ